MKSHNYSKEMVIEAAKMRKLKLPENIFEKKKEVNRRKVEVNDTSSECSESKEEEEKDEEAKKRENSRSKKRRRRRRNR